MERNSPSQLRDQFIRDIAMQRDSWSEDIDPLRSNNESDRWFENGDNFQRDSPHILEAESVPGDRDNLERDSLGEEDDELLPPIERDSQALRGNGDAIGCERTPEFVGRPLVKGARDPVMAEDYGLHEGDSLSVENAYSLGGGHESLMKGYDRLSVVRAHTMKDFEKQITELKKENFNLKLRIYFLEEQVQRHCDNSSEELHRMNIELKVEVESLKHEYQEKQNLLIRASKAMESLAGEHNFSIQQLKDDHLKRLHHLQEAGHQKIRLLEEQLDQEKAELEKICVLLDQERMQRFNAEERLLGVKDQYNKSMGILEERDWIIQCLNETLRSKDALITQLEKQIHTMDASKTDRLLPGHDLPEGRARSLGLTCRDCLATRGSEEKDENEWQKKVKEMGNVIHELQQKLEENKAGASKTDHLLPGHDLPGARSPGLTCRDCLATRGSEDENEWQKKVKEMGNVIRELQQKLEENKAGFAAEERNSLKRDKAIQGLTLALKKKTRENDKLMKEMENLRSALAGGSGQRNQSPPQNADSDYKKLIVTIQAQQDLCSRLHDYERESGSLQKELGAVAMLRKWLEKDIQSNQELRKILEAQIRAKYRESDTMSFLGDQTSYLSICPDQLGDHHHNLEAVTRPPMTSVETQTVCMPDVDGKLELSVVGKESKPESVAAVAVRPDHEFAGGCQSTASSSTQHSADDGVTFGNETSGGINYRAKEILRVSQSRPNTCEIQYNKQQKCFSNNLTKSRIPVLKSSTSKRPKKEAGLPFRGNGLICLEKELQEENARLLEELKCAKLEIGALKSDKDHSGGTLDLDDTGNSESSRESLRGGHESNRRWSEQFCEEAATHSTSPFGLETSEIKGSLQQELNIELQSKNTSELKSHNLENKSRSSNDVVPEATNTISLLDEEDLVESNVFAHPRHKELQLDHLRLAEQLQRAKLDIERLQGREVDSENQRSLSDLDGPCPTERDLAAQSVIKKLQVENLQLAELDIKRLQAREEDSESPKSLSNLDSLMERDLVAQSVIKELQLENIGLAEQLQRAKLDIERLQGREVDLENQKTLSDLVGPCPIERDLATQSLIKELQLENLRLAEQLQHAKLDLERLQGREVDSENQKSLSDLETSEITGSLQQERNIELLSKYNKLSEKLKSPGNEVVPESTNTISLLVEEDLVESNVFAHPRYKELQLDNLRLAEQLQRAKLDIERLQGRGVESENQKSLSDLDSLYLMGGDTAMQSVIKELQLENLRLAEQLQRAKLDIQRLQTREVDSENQKSLSDLETSEIKRSLQQERNIELQSERDKRSEKLKSSEIESDLFTHPRHKELQLENLRLAEQLQRAKLDIERLQGREVDSENQKSLSDLDGPREKELAVQSVIKELQLENLRLAEQLQGAKLDIERLRVREVDWENQKSLSDLDGSCLTERDLATQSVIKELQMENLQLAEQLQRAKLDLERLQGREVDSENQKTLSDLDGPRERDLAVQSVIKELQAENQRLVEQLKSAQVEIEKLREEKVLDDIDNSFRLDNLDTEDRDSEHSFLDKTITHAISLSEIHHGNPDFQVQVNSHNFTCQNLSGLCCHHDRFCLECADNQETLIFQTSSFKKVSTVQKECKLLTVSHSHRPFEDTSLSKYDLLVQSQARELSHQRQKLKESHNLSVVCSKNFINVIKSFEDLISTASLDSNIALGFQEQLAQTVEWLKELEYKLSDAYYGEDDANSDHSADSLLYTPSRLVPGHKMWADKHGCHVLGLVEDYNALRKQIHEAKAVLEETDAFVDHGVQTAVLNMTEHFGNVFFEKLNRTKQSLEEASCLLKLLWRVSLPLQTHNAYNIRQIEETNLEMTRLRKRVLEQEKLLSGMVKRVYSETQVKEDIEKLILHQLAMTHEILKRAKGNLEVQVVDKN